MGCAAALLIAHFKKAMEAGGVYIEAPDRTPHWENYTYHIYKGEDALQIACYSVTNEKETLLAKGPISEVTMNAALRAEEEE